MDLDAVVGFEVNGEHFEAVGHPEIVTMHPVPEPPFRVEARAPSNYRPGRAWLIVAAGFLSAAIIAGIVWPILDGGIYRETSAWGLLRVLELGALVAVFEAFRRISR